MRLALSLCLVACAGRALAQHEGHTMHAAGDSSPRFSFAASLLYADYGTQRGGRQVALRDWEMFRSPEIGGRLRFRAMTSLASLIHDSIGMPSLLQTGGTYRHSYIHDVQHRDDLIMEAAAELRLRRVLLTVAPIGAPALGPTPYLHRPSAASDPVAPIGHHWQDASHVSYGVATLGVSAGPATLEASAFNARESDFKSPLPDFSHGRLDSFAGRAAVSSAVATLSGWWGYLRNHDPIAPAMQMHRYGTSLSIERGRSSSLAVWGMNVHHHDGSSHLLLHGDPNASPHVRSSSLLLESALTVGSSTTLFGRAERVMKNGEELGFQGGDLMALNEIRSLSLGAGREVHSTSFVRFSVGARGTLNIIPESIRPAYGSRRPAGFVLFAQARGLR